MTEKFEALKINWGYTGTRFACGPIEGDTITEITLRNKEGKLYFVSVSRMAGYFSVYVSDVPLYEILFWIADRGTDMDAELKTLEKTYMEFYSSELDEYDEILESRYVEEMKLALAANDYYCHNEDEGMDAEEWLDEYNNGEMEVTWPHSIDYDEEEDIEE